LHLASPVPDARKQAVSHLHSGFAPYLALLWAGARTIGALCLQRTYLSLSKQKKTASRMEPTTAVLALVKRMSFFGYDVSSDLLCAIQECKQ
jgi:hypothetical protein